MNLRHIWSKLALFFEPCTLARQFLVPAQLCDRIFECAEFSCLGCDA